MTVAKMHGAEDLKGLEYQALFSVTTNTDEVFLLMWRADEVSLLREAITAGEKRLERRPNLAELMVYRPVFGDFAYHDILGNLFEQNLTGTTVMSATMQDST